MVCSICIVCDTSVQFNLQTIYHPSPISDTSCHMNDSMALDGVWIDNSVRLVSKIMASSQPTL
jgi:hypothetical protein